MPQGKLILTALWSVDSFQQTIFSKLYLLMKPSPLSHYFRCGTGADHLCRSRNQSRNLKAAPARTPIKTGKKKKLEIKKYLALAYLDQPQPVITTFERIASTIGFKQF